MSARRRENRNALNKRNLVFKCKVRVIRKRRNLTLRALAKMCHMPHTTILFAERGDNVTLQTAFLISEALHSSLYELWELRTPHCKLLLGERKKRPKQKRCYRYDPDKHDAEILGERKKREDQIREDQEQKEKTYFRDEIFATSTEQIIRNINNRITIVPARKEQQHGKTHNKKS